MEQETLTYSFFLIFTGAALLATLALATRQPIIIAYIVLGALLGPYGFQLINDVNLIAEVSKIGIVFLLFLLGLDMQPQSLLHILRKATLVAIISCGIFALAGFAVAISFGFSAMESAIIGAAMMFSSTIIGIKLLPTTVLHHKPVGEMMIGLLLLQDLLAITVLIVLLSGESGELDYYALGKAATATPLLVGVAYAFVKYALLPIIKRFDRIHEFIFLIALGWCLGMAELAKLVGLSHEIGAFVGGVSLATSPIALYIADQLRPLRDFFLILFFFSLGAGFNLGMLAEVAVPALVLGALMLGLKPLVFRILLGQLSEKKSLSWDVGLRLGQNSEFSLLIAQVAITASLIGSEASHLIQATAIYTFVVSSYIVIFNVPNPIAVSDRLRRD
ncbi:MAG: cation:proton antiporter [Pseudomonadales bacterium]